MESWAKTKGSASWPLGLPPAPSIGLASPPSPPPTHSRALSHSSFYMSSPVAPAAITLEPSPIHTLPLGCVFRCQLAVHIPPWLPRRVPFAAPGPALSEDLPALSLPKLTPVDPPHYGLLPAGPSIQLDLRTLQGLLHLLPGNPSTSPLTGTITPASVKGLTHWANTLPGP